MGVCVEVVVGVRVAVGIGMFEGAAVEAAIRIPVAIVFTVGKGDELGAVDAD